MTLEHIHQLIRDVPDFPKPGIVFKDITPILERGEAFGALTRHMAERVPAHVNKIVAIESRGFILGSAVAQYLRCGLVIVRKPGKLPRATLRETYELEYGSDALEVHEDALRRGDRVVVIDDVLATGGTAAAAERLCDRIGAQVLTSIFLMEIEVLRGRDKLKNPSTSLIVVR